MQELRVTSAPGVASELLARGERIKAIVRDPNRGATWRDRGAEIAVGSLEDRAFLAKTLAGAARFFVLLPPNETETGDYFAAQRRTSDAIAGAVKDGPIPHVVMLSSLGAELADGTGPIKSLHYLENALRATGKKLIAIRACYFQENIAGVIPGVRDAGIYPNFLPSADMAIPMIATRDIGGLAAALLTSAPERSETVDLVGPMYSARQLADKLGTALGKRLQVVDIPEAGQVEVMIQAGLPRPVAEVYAEMYRAIGSGLITSNGDRTVTGKPPSTTSYPTFSQTNKRKPLRNGAVLSRDERTGCAAAPRAAARRMSFPVLLFLTLAARRLAVPLLPPSEN